MKILTCTKGMKLCTFTVLAAPDLCIMRQDFRRGRYRLLNGILREVQV